MITKIKTIIVTNRLSNFPIISLGLVSILFKFSGSFSKKASAPVTMNNVKNEKIIKFNNKLKKYGLLQFVRSGRISVSKESMEITKFLKSNKNE